MTSLWFGRGKPPVGVRGTEFGEPVSHNLWHAL